jgi:putative transposase
VEGAVAFRPLKAAKNEAALAAGFVSCCDDSRTTGTSNLFHHNRDCQSRRLFQVEVTANLMLETLQHYRTLNRFVLHAFVIMLDHLHALLTPSPDVSLEKAMQFLKGGFSFRLKSKREVWERSYNEVQILSREKFESCRRYIEENPIKSSLSATAREYRYSSACLANKIDPMPEHFEKARG